MIPPAPLAFLLGLDTLSAADIVPTVVTPALQGLAILAFIVAPRTALNYSRARSWSAHRCEDGEEEAEPEEITRPWPNWDLWWSALKAAAIPTGPNHFTMPVMAIWGKILCLTRFPDSSSWKGYDFLDLDKVGIWGHSGGGFATAAAMFKYPDFFKVGISESGNHDNRNYEDDWGERYIGLEIFDEDGVSQL